MSNKNNKNNNNKKTATTKKAATSSTTLPQKKKTTAAAKEVKGTGSRVNRHQDLYDEDFNNTKQQQFAFDNLEITSTLDTSFIENKKNVTSKKNTSKVEKPKVEIVYKYIYRIPFFVMLMLLLILCSIGIYHYATVNHSKTVDATKAEVTVDDNYLFLGDSITSVYDLEKYYPDLPVVNSGISGNMTNDILGNMEERVYRYNPSKVFLLIGTNDLLKDSSVDDIVDGVTKIVTNIQKNRPYSKIYLESILPVNHSDDDKIDEEMVSKKRPNEKIREINSKLKEMAVKKKITYIDLYTVLADDNQELKLEYTSDGLHLSEEGYRKVTDVLMNYIKK